MPPIRLILDKDQTETYVTTCRNMEDWSNSRRTLTGKKVSPLQRASYEVPSALAPLTVDSRLAYMTDDPDYVVAYRGTPIMWHSTVRGIRHRRDVTAWEWVIAELTSGTPEYRNQAWNRHVERMHNVRDILNARIIEKRP